MTVGCRRAEGETTGEGRWLEAARSGERWALEELYRAHLPAVRTLCLRLLASPDDADDAAQTTFVKAFRALPRFRGASSLRTWLYRIAVNESMAMLRQHRSAPLDRDAPAPPDDRASRLAVRLALQKLKPEQRTLLTLRYWEELGYEEIAQVLGVPVTVMKMRLARARAAFQREYGEDL